MILFSHFAFIGFSNSYLVGPDRGGDAVLIDPGIFDVKLLQLIEDNHLYVRNVLITHAHKAHINGVKTLLKIYDAELYSFRSTILDFPANEVRDGDTIHLGEFTFDTYETPGHSKDSVVFKLDHLLFTGDTLTAGSIGTAVDGYAKGLELASIRKKILTLEDWFSILPGHGPPSKIGIEKKLNPLLKEKL